MVRVDLGEHPMSVKRFRIYICEHCVEAMAKRVAELKGLAWVSPSQAEAMQAASRIYADTAVKLEAAEAKLADLAEFAREL